MNISKRRKIAYSIITVVSLLCAMEILSQAVLYFSIKSRSGKPVEEINHGQPLPYEFKPGSEGLVGGGLAKINEAGLRGGPLAEAGSRKRVLCLGGSTTFGTGVTNDGTYPAFLQRFLDRQSPGEFFVINAGMPGYSSLGNLDFLIYRGTELKPEFVIISTGFNDVTSVHGLMRKPWQSSSIFERFGLFRLHRPGLGHSRP
jgi:hypothetical protein